ncbi:MAG: exo-alpha-sialidase [Chloroflexi bacterium]|nr:exo-alpha-sialidase [Chloroflexota bacterium]MCI0575536.1 exo-alpha-sialidase [Chloroflexota bacterium]MCI0644313.1 exo-alpha-sialidase [Chloroflexota bacterium]MCI0726296.1 exo-alpha-sialidase [Chloroflexota bacterium]
MTLNRKRCFTAFVLFFLLSLTSVASLSVAVRVAAQSGNGSWSTPVNISQSGAATSPQIVVDASGTVHVVWQDSLAGFVYMRGDGETWDSATPVELPFGRQIFLLGGGSSRPLYTPLLKADSSGRIHAFWMDDEQALFYSRVTTEEFSTLASWTNRQQLGEAALDVEVAVDTAGRLHLSYVRPLDSDQFPAGIYYRQSSDGGTTWTNPVLLYASPYFRVLAASDAHLQVVTLETGQVVVAWDNRPQERIFTARSADGGATWEAPVEIDRRQESDGELSAGPNQITLLALGNTLHMMWQAGHDGFECAQYYQQSADGGATWQLRRRIPETAEGCLETGQFLVGPGDLLMLLAASDTGAYLLAWDGAQWSDPRRQAVLAAFLNPETYRTVEFGCRQAVPVGERLLVIGCDAAGNRKDVWLVSRPLPEVMAEFTAGTTGIWRSPAAVTTSDSPNAFLWPALVADADGQLHAFWSQAAGGSATIHYARWDGLNWSQPVDVLASPEGQPAEEPAVAIYGDRLLVTWSSGQGGEVYFSQSPAGLAISPAEWLEPVPLPIPRITAGAPTIAVNGNGDIYVAYTLRFNEDRGVYLTRSEDGGSSWSDPLLVFDGVAAGWEVVDQPSLVVTGDGVLHAMWMHRSLPPANTPLALAYAASTDNGETWSEANEFPFEATPPVWGDLVASGLETVHRVWQENEENDPGTFWAQVSPDGGLSWERPVRISDVGNPAGPATLTVDGAGRPVLLQMVNAAGETAGDVLPVIQQWSWTEGGWTTGESLVLATGASQGQNDLAAVVAAGGNLGVIYTGLTLNVETGRAQEALLFNQRALELVVATPTPSPQPTSGTSQTPEPTLTPTLSPLRPTPTAVFPRDLSQGTLAGGGLGSVAAFVPVGLVVLVVLFVGMRMVRGNR